jgi:hypothetical protein
MADISETPGWRSGVLFLMFAVVSVSGWMQPGRPGCSWRARCVFGSCEQAAAAHFTHKPYKHLTHPLIACGRCCLSIIHVQLLVERLGDFMEHRLRNSKQGQARRSGLLTMISFIKQELCMLGLISLLLTAVQSSLMMIWCARRAAAHVQLQVTSLLVVVVSHLVTNRTPPPQPAPPRSIPNSVAAYGLHWYPEKSLPPYSADDGPGYGRRLLAPPPGAGEAKPTCPEGQAQLFSAHMIYQVHLLLFLIAVTLAVYVAGTLLLCLMRVGAGGAL